ncbi:MAG TPA: NADH-quinone oxidoreductase subunit A [Sandaracinaceae bacterium]
MFEIYLPVLLMIAVAVTIPTLLFVLGTVLGPRRPTAEKLIPYESGSETTGAANVRLSVKFYLTAILFVVFDIEAVFLYPWAARFRELGWFGLVEMIFFIAVLAITLVYAWRKGALEWQR